ncbi:MAG: STN domain-containing protein, partial [Bacteroidales bacterium]|nr:STN domain-containing protein [Bacteroidales bacterium]
MKKIFFSIILCSLSTFLLSAAEPDMPVPQDAVITISGSRITLESFISQVEKQTGYLFVYSKQDVNVNSVLPVQEGKKTVAAFLAEAFGNSNLKYVFENQYIVLTYKAPEYSTVSGTVLDAQTRKPLVFAS